MVRGLRYHKECFPAYKIVPTFLIRKEKILDTLTLKIPIFANVFLQMYLLHKGSYARNLVISAVLSHASPFQSRCSRTHAVGNKIPLTVLKITICYKILQYSFIS